MECPVCLVVQKTIANPSCEVGHVICGPCRKQVTDCPTCRDDFTEDVSAIQSQIVELLNDQASIINKKKPRVYERDPVVLKRREKQIMYGKNTADYDTYIKLVPKYDREDVMPRTPDYRKVYSRRQWDGAVKAWKLSIHSTVAQLEPGKEKSVPSGVYYSRSVLLMLKNSPMAYNWPPPLNQDYKVGDKFNPVAWYSATSPTSCRTRSRLLKETAAKYRSLKWESEAAVTYRNLQEQVQRLRREVDAVVGYKREEEVDAVVGYKREEAPVVAYKGEYDPMVKYKRVYGRDFASNGEGVCGGEDAADSIVKRRMEEGGNIGEVWEADAFYNPSDVSRRIVPFMETEQSARKENMAQHWAVGGVRKLSQKEI